MTTIFIVRIIAMDVVTCSLLYEYLLELTVFLIDNVRKRDFVLRIAYQNSFTVKWCHRAKSTFLSLRFFGFVAKAKWATNWSNAFCFTYFHELLIWDTRMV